MNDFENKQNVLNNDNNNSNNGKKIKIIEGDSKELNISKVKDSLPFESSENCEKNKENIVVPKNQED